MTTKIWSLVIDIMSIQKYCFASNKLKENLGASSIIKQVYKEYLQEVLNEICGVYSWDDWKKQPENVKALDGQPCEIGYIGGGNALIFFHEKDKLDEFVSALTRNLLVKAPGLELITASREFDLGKYAEEIKALFNKLQENKNRYISSTIISQHGITVDCTNSGFSSENWYKVQNESKYISSVSSAKLQASENQIIDLEDDLKNKYTLTNDIQKLGQVKGEDNHIAIVHIDGNDMGERFQKQTSLQDARKLSFQVSQAINSALNNTIEFLVKKNKIQQEMDLRKEKGKYILPLRSIIVGGDDITVVVNGQLGIYFAKLFILELEKAKDIFGGKITSCAGIAITKTSYPFYRGYKLAEELCANAKRKRKEQKSDCSWLDFHISIGGISGSLEDIREKQYRVGENSLLFRPYPFNKEEENDIHLMICKTRELFQEVDAHRFPRSKLEALRKTLTLGKEQQKMFVQEQKMKNRTLPKFPMGNYDERLFIGNKTPYLDILELLEFYPQFELKGSSGDL